MTSIIRIYRLYIVQTTNLKKMEIWEHVGVLKFNGTKRNMVGIFFQ